MDIVGLLQATVRVFTSEMIRKEPKNIGMSARRAFPTGDL